MPHEALLDRWAKLIDVCSADQGSAAPLLAGLLKAYGDPRRAYHNLDHLTHLFSELDAVALWDSAVEWAAWYHDVVYEPGARDNEKRSAEVACEALNVLGLTSQFASRVAQLIEATCRHEARDDDIPLNLFLDADMAILGAAPGRYEKYRPEIRQEYRHIPGPLYQHGRRAFLKDILTRPHLFLTDHFRERYERQARTNLRDELLGGR